MIFKQIIVGERFFPNKELEQPKSHENKFINNNVTHVEFEDNLFF